MTKRGADSDQPPPRDNAASGQPGQSGSESAFDLWLNRGLHQIFDDVAREPLPEELLRLIEDDRKS